VGKTHEIAQLIIITIIVLVITFMEGIYNHISETNPVYRVGTVAAILYLQFMLRVMLFYMLHMLYTFTLILHYYYYYYHHHHYPLQSSAYKCLELKKQHCKLHR
jgi:Ca2+/Na+ antiporter